MSNKPSDPSTVPAAAPSADGSSTDRSETFRSVPTAAINRFCLDHGLTIAANPCISPDFCLDWPRLARRLAATDSSIRHHTAAAFSTASGSWELVEDADGDHAWLLAGAASAGKSSAADSTLAGGVRLADGRYAFPASWANLLALKDLVLAHDPAATIFPSAAGTLARSSLGIGARFTTLHWPAVQWAMASLGLSLTANQNSIPRELVYDVEAMLGGRLDSVPFPFIGANVPEGHQGQSVEGMSHGAVLATLKNGFHRRRIPWGFNADHQPVGGKFDAREGELVRGCVLASYITFDLSPELAATAKPDVAAAAGSIATSIATNIAANIPAEVNAGVRARLAACSVAIDEAAFTQLLCAVWPAVSKMKRRDELYAAARERAFSVAAGRAYFRELSIDELPGLTTPETLATMLALCEALGMRIHFVAPAFGFQKNFPFADDAELERRVAAAWAICQRFGVSIGFHSGSGKSADNYRICGRVTGGALEIKTSGRYTYEMGVALARSTDERDQALWRDWWRFTRDLSAASAFSADATERAMARQFITHALEREGRPTRVFDDADACRAALSALSPSTEHMFWFEYNFLFVLARGGAPDKAGLGDHSPAGYRQRARFYAISDQARLAYAQGVASYILFLAETTGLAPAGRCAEAKRRLDAYTRHDDLITDIAPPAPSASPQARRGAADAALLAAGGAAAAAVAAPAGMLRTYALIALGSALGGMARYAMAFAIDARVGGSFPWGTIAVNILGCFAIGLVGGLSEREWVRHFGMVGVLGGFTTFSAFAWQTHGLAKEQHIGAALANVGVSVGVCLVAVWIGFVVAKCVRTG